MKSSAFSRLLLMVLFLALAPTALASNTWYVNGANGSDSNKCMSPTTACKTIGHAVSLAHSGDSIMVAAATYKENLTIGISLKILGSGAKTTIIDGGGVKTVVTVSNANSHISLSKLTMQNGSAQCGGGIYNIGALAISNSTISGNSSRYGGGGGGICNRGTLTINDCTINGNQAKGSIELFSRGGGIDNSGPLTINRSALSGNSVRVGDGGGIYNSGPLTINNSTVSGNSAGNGVGDGGGIYDVGAATLTINNSTVSGNSAGNGVGGIYRAVKPVVLQNSIVAKNSGGNCHGTMTSNGYNLSSDGSCDFDGPGDLNNTDPKLGKLGNYGGPTQTIPLLFGSPAIDSGNPSGCTDGQGHLLKIDQRGMPRPNPEDTGGCDMGAFEEQSDGCIPPGGNATAPVQTIVALPLAAIMRTAVTRQAGGLA